MVLTRDTSSCRDDHCAKQFSNPTMPDEVIGRTRLQNVKLKKPIVILTFDPATWFLHATHRLILMIVCVK